jgi:glycosyltransferase involved in cell wall biosynthesis
VVAGRLEEQKGHAVLFDALAEVRKRGLDFTLALAGDGRLRGELEQRAEQLGLGNRIRFLGTLDDVGPLLAAADAVVLPSLWEGLPLVLLEAMVRSRPIVATNVGGVPEAIDNGVHGVLVPPGEALALADELERFHRKTERAVRLGRAAGERVRRDFLWQAVAEGFEAVYDDVLGLATFSPEDAAPAPRRAGR